MQRELKIADAFTTDAGNAVQNGRTMEAAVFAECAKAHAMMAVAIAIAQKKEV